MTQPKGKAGVAILVLAAALALTACSSASPEGSPGHGIVQDLDAAAGEITLDHGDIPGLMKGMTMTFRLAPGIALEGIAVGSEVDFRAKEEGGVYTVTQIRPSAP